MAISWKVPDTPEDVVERDFNWKNMKDSRESSYTTISSKTAADAI